MLNRKGAKSSKDVPEDVLQLLNLGEIETVNLMEALALDMQKLYKTLFNNKDFLDPDWEQFNALGWVAKMKAMPAHLYIHTQYKYFDLLSKHQSDMLRSWGAGLVGYDQDLSITERLDCIKPFANDSHFNVREIAWIYMRDHIIDALDESFEVFQDWAKDDSPNIRRFASEATRPRGVWCVHIDSLKKNPTRGKILLESLKADPSKYVQDSVANWLNDASKTYPDWVSDLCKDWQSQSDDKATQYICKRAMRTIQKDILK